MIVTYFLVVDCCEVGAVHISADSLAKADLLAEKLYKPLSVYLVRNAVEEKVFTSADFGF